ncbi:MAG: phage portal protein [Ruminococcaceae bacterium]|nr:phage portal protein [Oscillospiraceae bacterium]
MDSAKRVISGTWGEVWMDGEYCSECYGCKLSVKANKEKIQMAGKMAVDNKITSIEQTGSLKLYKCNSRMAIKIGDKLKRGEDVRCTVISKLDDPDAYGAERVSVTGVSFDDLTLADWEVGKTGSTENPFTYTDYKYLDTITEE